MKKRAEEARRKDSDDEDSPTKTGISPDRSVWGGSQAGASLSGSKSGGAPAKPGTAP